MATLEFFDYIFDRYAYLGLATDASANDIAREIRQRRAAIHPDKLLRVSESILATAAREREYVDECARILNDPEMRLMYDQKLATFKASEPHLVSPTGVALFDPSRFRIDLDYLLSSEAMSLDMVEAQARSMSGLDEKRLAKARKRALDNPDDFDDRDAFRDELTKKLIFLSIMEDFLWQAAGVNGALANDEHSRAQDGAHFEEALALKMEAIKSQAHEAVGRRHEMASLGMAPRLLLAGPDEPSATSTSLVDELADKVVESIEQRADTLRETVAQKSLVIDELAQYSRWAWAADKPSSPFLDIVMIRSSAEYDENWPGQNYEPAGFLIRIDRETRNASPLIERPSRDDLLKWPNQAALLEANPEIPGLFIEAFALANKLIELSENPIIGAKPPSGPKA